jgi:hypothetical protein
MLPHYEPSHQFYGKAWRFPRQAELLAVGDYFAGEVGRGLK